MHDIANFAGLHFYIIVDCNTQTLGLLLLSGNFCTLHSVLAGNSSEGSQPYLPPKKLSRQASIDKIRRKFISLIQNQAQTRLQDGQ
jgi:hypothetical protein